MEGSLNKIEDFATNIWKKTWENDPQYKPTKLFHASQNINKSQHILKMGTNKLGTCIKGITGLNNLAYFQSNHLMTDCEATTRWIPLPDMIWSVREINAFIQHPKIYQLMSYDTEYANWDIESWAKIG